MKRVINGKTYSKVLGIKQGSLLTAGKDGDIEEYKADPTDAGKVLTVGEDGSVTPAEGGGGGSLFNHYIYIDYNNEFGSFVITSSSETPFNAASFVELLHTNNIDGTANNKKIWGTVHYSSVDVGSVYLNDYDTKMVTLQRGASGSTSTNELKDSRIRDTVVSV